MVHYTFDESPRRLSSDALPDVRTLDRRATYVDHAASGMADARRRV